MIEIPILSKEAILNIKGIKYERNATADELFFTVIHTALEAQRDDTIRRVVKLIKDEYTTGGDIEALAQELERMVK
jgi:hypothetical protein